MDVIGNAVVASLEESASSGRMSQAHPSSSGSPGGKRGAAAGRRDQGLKVSSERSIEVHSVHGSLQLEKSGGIENSRI